MAAEAGHAVSRAYRDQSGHEHLNGANVYDGAENVLAQKVTFTPVAGGANVTNVTIQIQDGAGNNVAAVLELGIWLSDAATGAGLAAHTPTGTTGVGSAGTELQQKISKLAMDCLTDATGKYVLQITDTAKTGYFICVGCPGTGVTWVSAQLLTANYG